MSAPAIRVRPARPCDVPAVVAMVHELAAYEKAPEQCHLTDAALAAALFPVDAPPALFGHVAVDEQDTPVGFGLWFLNFSTWEGRHGIYLEDLYVRPAARGAGAGRALLTALAEECLRRGYPRLECWVLHWNPARDFYRTLGATAMTEWVPYRISGEALRGLATAAQHR